MTVSLLNDILYLTFISLFTQMYDLVSGDLLCNLVFDVSITSVTMDTAEYRLFAGGSNGVIHCIDMFEMVIFLY